MWSFGAGRMLLQDRKFKFWLKQTKRLHECKTEILFASSASDTIVWKKMMGIKRLMSQTKNQPNANEKRPGSLEFLSRQSSTVCCFQFRRRLMGKESGVERAAGITLQEALTCRASCVPIRLTEVLRREKQSELLAPRCDADEGDEGEQIRTSSRKIRGNNSPFQSGFKRKLRRLTAGGAVPFGDVYGKPCSVVSLWPETKQKRCVSCRGQKSAHFQGS